MKYALLLSFMVVFVWSPSATALDYDVTATVPADPPSIAPEVIVPASLKTVSDSLVNLGGSCEVMTPASIVSIWRDGVSIGSAICRADGTFALPVTLVPGENHLIPRGSSFTGQFGPDGQEIVLRYVPTVVSTDFSAISWSALDMQPKISPLVIMTDRPFYYFEPNRPFDVVVTIDGGAAPHFVSLSWGDGQKFETTLSQPGSVALEHLYDVARSHTIRATATDSSGQRSSLAVVAVTLSTEPIKGVLTANSRRPNIWFYVYLVCGITMIVGGFRVLKKHRKIESKS